MTGWVEDILETRRIYHHILSRGTTGTEREDIITIIISDQIYFHLKTTDI